MNSQAHSASLLEWQDIQGLLRTGYRHYPESLFIRLHLNDSTSPEDLKLWLASLLQTPSTSSSPWHIHHGDYMQIPRDDRAPILNIAFSMQGLQRFGVSSSALNTFPLEFVDGMGSDRASQLLGDLHEDHHSAWAWGGENKVPHIVLLAYASSRQAFPPLIEHLNAAALGDVHLLHTRLEEYEHFGFRDGISNPVLQGSTHSLDTLQRNPEGAIAAGEFIFGYSDQHHQLPLSPSVPQASDPGNALPQAEVGLTETDPLFQLARRDLGRNGSFLVVRQLEQDVDAFESFLQTHAADNPEYLAARMMGRWRNGSPLSLSPATSQPCPANPSNHFHYKGADEHGHRCPSGAHIRRSNPRDSLLENAQRSWDISNRHRLLRRGRLYEEEGRKGLLFMCLNVSLARQFEHIQSHWINSSHFAHEYETDPVVGSRAIGDQGFTLPQASSRQHIANLPRFVTLRGGAYFFLPGMSALRYLSKLP